MRYDYSKTKQKNVEPGWNKKDTFKKYENYYIEHRFHSPENYQIIILKGLSKPFFIGLKSNKTLCKHLMIKCIIFCISTNLKKGK